MRDRLFGEPSKPGPGTAEWVRGVLRKSYMQYPVLGLEELVHKATTPRDGYPKPGTDPAVLLVFSVCGPSVTIVRQFLDRAVELNGLHRHGPLDITVAASAIAGIAMEAGYEIRFVELPNQASLTNALDKQIAVSRIAGITIDVLEGHQHVTG